MTTLEETTPAVEWGVRFSPKPMHARPRQASGVLARQIN